MDFSPPEATLSLLIRFRAFVEHEVFPLEREALSRPFSEVEPALSVLRDRAQEMDLWAPHVPRELGGMGLSFLDHALVSEELGRSPFGHYVFNCQAPDAGNMEILAHFATHAQKDRWLAPLVRGECRSCFAMTEPEYPGSNPVWMATKAVKHGDHYVIDGHKWFISGADGAQFAIVMAVTQPDAEPHRRASLIVVPTDTPGFRRVRNLPVMGSPGEGWASHSELRFDGCRVSCENLLGKEGEGFAIAQARLGPGRIHHTMRWIGVCERAFDMLCHRAATRELAPGERLGSRQTIQNWIAESRAAIDAARLLVLQAAWKIDRHGLNEAREEISAIKFHVAGVMLEVVDRAIQAHGALGICDDTVLAWFYRHERGARIYDGPDEVHKTVVARRILKRYGLAL
jgi:alkylation response protein AidB-like acyl-CoA dehydrogenase